MDPFKAVPIVGIENKTQVINMCEERINAFEKHMGVYPGPYDPLNGIVYITWERRAFAWIGEIKGSLLITQIMGAISPEEYLKLYNRAMGVIHRAMEKIMMGQRQ